jgi:single-stranded-DNA-specific exonuclease
MAAGLALDADRIPAFADALSGIADREIPDSVLAQKVRLDVAMPLTTITPDLLPDLARFQPHGIGNPEPVFGAFGVVVAEARRIGRDQAHLALAFAEGDCRVPAVWWGAAAELPPAGAVVDAAFSIEPDPQQGRPRMKVRDLRPHEAGNERG